MIFTEENIKYCLLTFDRPMKDHIESYAQDELCISGLYHWSRLFRGDFNFPLWPEDTERYNVIHVNVTPRNIPLLDQLIPMVNRNKTKLLFNVDHSVHLWMTTFPYPVQLLTALDKADYIFGVEPLMCEMLTDALKRPVPCIPHPVDVKQLKKLQKRERAQRVGVSIHRYYGNTVLPWFAINELPQGWVTTAIGARGTNFAPKIHHLYPEVQPYLKFKPLMEFVADLYAVVESYFIASYGRLTAECAALGVPVVGCKGVGAQARCFPETGIEQFNPIQFKKTLHRLINDQDFYTAIIRHAVEAVEFYSLIESKKRMLAFLNNDTKE